MYKHILLPVDGSRLSEDAAKMGIAIARSMGARVTAFHVVPDSNATVLDAWTHAGKEYAGKLAETFEARGEQYVSEVRDAARLSGVPCECRIAHGPSPHAGILAEAREAQCDLIVMASHGRGDPLDELVDSETVKVVMRGDTPVLVHHVRRDRDRRASA